MNTPPPHLVIVVTQAGVTAGPVQPPPAPDPDPCRVILDALAGRYIQLNALVKLAGCKRRWTLALLHRLVAEGRVRHKRGKGYFRPDAPPA